jgi:hypothetical protein
MFAIAMSAVSRAKPSCLGLLCFASMATLFAFSQPIDLSSYISLMCTAVYTWAKVMGHAVPMWWLHFVISALFVAAHGAFCKVMETFGVRAPVYIYIFLVSITTLHLNYPANDSAFQAFAESFDAGYQQL